MFHVKQRQGSATSGLTMIGNRRTPKHPSLRAQRSNPESLLGDSLDCFVARASRNDRDCGPT
ncbi:hypothetical protein GPL20_22160 [Bradyrhizobium cajani]|uniref:Uncharacterized protein n=1 Tax=Bradyrhizobium cajani TaxID=1928661 RepID=A0A844T9B2_9BRAD|nr:hypothetical protein [Bradyrhizobium cajani]